MRRFLLLLNLLWWWPAFIVFTQPIETQSEEIRAINTAIKEGKTEEIQKLRDYELSEVFPVLRSLIARKNDLAAKEALEVLRSFPDAEDVVAADIKERMNVDFPDRTLRDDFEVLIALRTPKAARVIGPYLFDERVFHSGMHDVADQSVATYAAPALARFQIKGAPYSSSHWPLLGSKEVKEWQVWWEENKDNLEAALNPPIQAQTQAPPTQASGTEPNLPPRPEAPSPEEEKAPSTSDAANSNIPALLLVILGSLLAALAAILLRRGRK